MTDFGARSITKAICFLGLCMIRAALVFKSPSDYGELIKISRQDRDRIELL